METANYLGSEPWCEDIVFQLNVIHKSMERDREVMRQEIAHLNAKIVGLVDHIAELEGRLTICPCCE